MRTKHQKNEIVGNRMRRAGCVQRGNETAKKCGKLTEGDDKGKGRGSNGKTTEVRAGQGRAGRNRYDRAAFTEERRA